MLIIKNAKFAKNDNEAIKTLFTDKTFSGYYKRYKHWVLLMDIQRNPIAAIVRAKDTKRAMMVSCSEHDGRLRFNHALADNTQYIFGFEGYQDEMYWAEQAIAS